MRAEHLWLIDREHREPAQDDATILAVRDQERAGLDIVSDGEQARESYSNHFATALDGVDLDKPGQTPNRFGKMIPVPRIAGKIRRKHPIEVHAGRDRARQHRSHGEGDRAGRRSPCRCRRRTISTRTRKRSRTPTRSRSTQEIKDLFAAGADIVQLDEPWMVSFADKARKYGIKALNRAIEGVTGKTAVHLCLGYAHVVKNKPSTYEFLAELEGSKADQISIETAEPKLDLAVLKNLPTKTVILGVLNLGDMTIETPEMVAGRIRDALKYVPAERLVIAPDCGMKYLPRDVAFGKMKAMVDGTRHRAQGIELNQIAGARATIHAGGCNALRDRRKPDRTLSRDRWNNVPDPRLRKIMTSLIKHLHAWVRDIEPTEAEWFAAIDFLTRTGKLCTDKRQEFILMSDMLGVSMLVDAINHRLLEQSHADDGDRTVPYPQFARVCRSAPTWRPRCTRHSVLRARQDRGLRRQAASPTSCSTCGRPTARDFTKPSSEK